MSSKLYDQAPTMMVVGTLFGALVQTLDQQSPGVRQGVLDRLDVAYRTLRDTPDVPDQTLAGLRFAAEQLREPPQ